MNLKELEAKKRELIERVEGWLFAGGEAPACCYNFDIEKFKKLPDVLAKGDYIKECFDGLLYSDNMLVISW